MTAIAGVICKDGVVIGADSSVTFTAGRVPTIEQKAPKIQIVKGKFIFAGTGGVGHGQRFTHELEQHIISSMGTHPPPIEFCTQLSAKVVKNFISTNTQQGSYGSLLAFSSKSVKFNLCEFDVNTLQPELKNKNIWYVSMGGGQQITDPFLGFIRKLFWKDGMPLLQQGIFAVLWTLQHAVQINPGGINEPIEIAILEPDGEKEVKARFLSPEEMQEHCNNIVELEKYIADYKKPTEKVAPDIPIPPDVSQVGNKTG